MAVSAKPLGTVKTSFVAEFEIWFLLPVITQNLIPIMSDLVELCREYITQSLTF